jgi:IS5 family transposase
MSYRKTSKTPSFSDLELARQTEKNRTLNTLSELDTLINWQPVEQRLLKSYPVGKKKKGPQAYSPIMLFKCLLLRNWFRISSDAELTGLLNDRFSFKSFVGLPMTEAAPDSSTFSRFRNRLPQEIYDDILSDISDQLSCRNIILNMGQATDIRIWKKRR